MHGSEFQSRLLAARPPNATHYRLMRRKFSQNRYYPDESEKALRCSPNFEFPVDAEPGTWMVIFYADEAGKVRVQHLGNSHYLPVELSMPDFDDKTGPAVDADFARLLTKGARPPDPVSSDPGLIETRIETRKRALIRREDRAEARDLARKGMSKDLLETYLAGRFLRRDNYELTDLLKRTLAPQVEQIERHFALMETSMVTVAKILEQGKAMVEKVASPPPPVDYTPVLTQLASAARDVIVVALQRGGRQETLGEDTAAVDAGLRPAPDAKLAKLTAERDRLRREIELLENAARKSADSVLVSAQASEVTSTSGPARANSAQLTREIDRPTAQASPSVGAQLAAAGEQAADQTTGVPPSPGATVALGAEVEGTKSSAASAPHPQEQTEAHAANEKLPKDVSLQTPSGPLSLHLPDGLLSGELANLLAGEIWDEGGATVFPTLSKVEVAEVAKVIVEPPKMTEAAARRALASGGAIEALGGLLFFNPAFRQLLRGSGK